MVRINITGITFYRSFKCRKKTLGRTSFVETISLDWTLNDELDSEKEKRGYLWSNPESSFWLEEKLHEGDLVGDKVDYCLRVKVLPF